MQKKNLISVLLGVWAVMVVPAVVGAQQTNEKKHKPIAGNEALLNAVKLMPSGIRIGNN